MAFPGDLLKEIVRCLQAALVRPFMEDNQGRQILLPGDQGCDVPPYALTTTSLGCGKVTEFLVCHKEASPACIALAQCTQPHVEENSPLEGEIMLSGPGKSHVIHTLHLSQPF